MSSVWRRFKRQFGISAPRMAVRTQLSWRWRALGLLALGIVIIGMWWWGFDFGQFLGGFNRGEVVQLRERLASETSELREELARLRASSVQLESDLSIAKATQASLSQQALELQTDNSQLKEEILFLQQLLAESGKQGGITIPRAQLERISPLHYRLSLLVVRGGRPEEDFNGRVMVLANLLDGSHPLALTLPDDEPDSVTPLTLKFRYYQRVELTFHAPPTSVVKSLQVRVFEAGQSSPKATRTVSVS